MTINVNNKSTINNVEGTRTHHACKAVIDKDTGVVYASATDAAEALGVSIYPVSACCLGKQKSVKGHHLSYVKHASENIDELTAQIRTMQAKIAELEADAAVGRAIREEREAKQRAEEERLNTIAYLKESITFEMVRKERRQNIVERIAEELQKSQNRLRATENKISEMEYKLHKLEVEGEN